MIHLVIGRQGSGKTLFLVKLAYHRYRTGNKKIFSNIHLKFPYKKLKYKDIIKCKLNDSIVILDEIHLLLSARRSMSKINVDICDNFLSMARKQNVEIFGTTQTMRKVDIRYTEEADYIYYCTKFVFDYKKNKWIEVLHTNPFPENVPILIDILIQETYSGETNSVQFLGNGFYKMYDTYEVVRIDGLPKGYKR